jgi:hypothetical protein
MRIPSALIFLLVFSGCASDAFTVTLFRTARATGVTERYAVNQDAIGTKTITLPADTDFIRSTYTIDPKLVAKIHVLITDSLASLAALELHDTGELTTGLHIDTRNTHKEISWANVDPPKLATPLLDSLYHIMLRAEAEMISH